ncbi:MAG: DUF1493 family protein [Pseudomonadaceae bacterium]|nr:DUF1493 family protein [Pseudomonadaceae bacterium]
MIEARLVDLASEFSGVDRERISMSSSIVKELELVGDTAEEFLSSVQSEFGVSLSDLDFERHFPTEASASMHYVLSSVRMNKPERHPILRLLSRVDSLLWSIWAKPKRYADLTLGELAENVRAEQSDL